MKLYEEKLITALGKYIGAFPRSMGYLPLAYYLSKLRQDQKFGGLSKSAIFRQLFSRIFPISIPLEPLWQLFSSSSVILCVEWQKQELRLYQTVLHCRTHMAPRHVSTSYKCLLAHSEIPTCHRVWHTSGLLL